MNRALTVIGVAGIGAGLSFLLDPTMGRQRRARLREGAGRVARSAGASDGTALDVVSRTRALVTGIRSRLTQEAVSDEALVTRVSARMRGVASNPAAIVVTASGGRVTLGGSIPAGEVDRLVKRIASVPGVVTVENRLEAVIGPGAVPAFEGQRAMSALQMFSGITHEWTPATRLMAGAAGAVLTVMGVTRPRYTGALVGALGAALLTRAVGKRQLALVAGRIRRRRHKSPGPRRAIDAGTHGIGW